MRPITDDERARLLAAGWQPIELDAVLTEVAFWLQTTRWDAEPAAVIAGGGTGKLAALRAVIEDATRDDV